MLSVVCKCVSKESALSFTPDSNDEMRADISVGNFWQRLQRAFVDIRVIYPFAPIPAEPSLAIMMKAIKKWKATNNEMQPANFRWWKWIFHSLGFLNNGEMSSETKQFYRRLSQLLCEESGVSYSDTSVWVKRQISYSLLWTSIICIRGSRSKKYNTPTEERMDIGIGNRVVDILL